MRDCPKRFNNWHVRDKEFGFRAIYKDGKAIAQDPRTARL